MITEAQAREAHDLVKRDFLVALGPDAQIAASLSLSVLCWVIGCEATDCPPRFDQMIETIKSRPMRAKAGQN